jgi:predicted nucleic acid-binding protein
MSFVLDASVCLSWLMPDEKHPDADAALLLLRRESAAAPVIWWFEIRNSLLNAERKGRLRGASPEELLQTVAALPIERRTEIEQHDAMRLSRQHRLTFYDASYLALALELRVPLATLDKELRDAARREGVPLISA